MIDSKPTCSDSNKEFRVDHAKIMGKDMHFIFALVDPLNFRGPPGEKIEMLEKKIGIKQRLVWDPNCKEKNTKVFLRLASCEK